MKSVSTPFTPSPLPATTLQNVRRCETRVSKIIPNVLKISPRFAHFWAASPEPSPPQQLQPSGLGDPFVAPPHLPAAHRRPGGPHGGGRGTRLGKRTGTPRPSRPAGDASALSLGDAAKRATWLPSRWAAAAAHACFPRRRAGGRTGPGDPAEPARSALAPQTQIALQGGSGPQGQPAA